MKAKTLLYIVGFYDIPPLNLLQKYLRESGRAKVTILLLPVIRSVKNRLVMEAFILDENGKKFENRINIFFPFPVFVKYVIQYLLNFYLLFKLLRKIKRKKFEICIAEPTFNAVLALILKNFGRCQFTVYMNGDVVIGSKAFKRTHYLPPNFLNKFLDNLLIKFQYFLRWLAYKNDLLWYPTEKIKIWDNQHGYFAKREMMASVVAVDFGRVKKNITVPKSNHSICYIGRFDEHAGLDMVISSLKLIKEKISNIEMVVVGGGYLAIENYKKIAEANGVLEHIKFYGFISKIDDAIAVLAKSGIGLALYKPVEDNESLYTESSKVKEYFKAGLPVIMAKGGPDICDDIVKYKSGVVVDYNKEDIAKNIITILTDQQLYKEMQKGVLEISKFFDYRENFKNAWNLIYQKVESRPLAHAKSIKKTE